MDAEDRDDLYDLGTLGPGRHSSDAYMNPDNSEEIEAALDTPADEKKVKDKAQEELAYRPATRPAPPRSMAKRKAWTPRTATTCTIWER